MDYQNILESITDEVRQYFQKGQVATYIPALANVDPFKFAMALTTVDGGEFFVGDNDRFSIQSISKVLTLTLAIRLNSKLSPTDKVNEEIWVRVGREPSGSPFNSLVQLEHENGIPRNPFINAGAIVIADYILSCAQNEKEMLLNFARELVLADNDGQQPGNKIEETNRIDFNDEVVQSERLTGFRNRALANFLRSFDNIKNDVDQVLDFYFHQCSMVVNCLNVSRMFLYLANKGVNPRTKQIILGTRQTKRVNSLMMTCGLYDSVGEFAYQVGLPAKSGVSGGIIAVLPNKFTVCVWSPELNHSGNSFVGVEALRLLTSKTGLSVF